MLLDRLLGNEQLKMRLQAMLRKGRLTHSFLLAGPAGSGKHTLATLLAAAMECTAPDKPCGVCAQCRKVLAGQHPDVITVDDAEKKTVSVGLVRSACADLYIRPNEGSRKVYLFPRAADMNRNGQNALLKVTEEPPDYGAYLFLAENALQLLPTVRSRCVTLQLSPLSHEVCLHALKERFPAASVAASEAAFVQSGGFLGQAIDILSSQAVQLPQTAAFIKAYAHKDASALAELLVPMERLKREGFRPLLGQWITLLSEALSLRLGAVAPSADAAAICKARTAAELMQAITSLQEALKLCDANVNIAAICGALQIQLR